MKIEINCSSCNSTMQLDNAHAGKQARCPVCGSISQIPATGNKVVPESNADKNANENEIEGYVPSQQKRKLRDSVFDEPQPEFTTTPRTTQKVAILGMDQNILIAFSLGTISIVSNFLCCGPYVGFPASVVGLIYTLLSVSSLKQSGFVINGIGLLISLATLAYRYWL